MAEPTPLANFTAKGITKMERLEQWADDQPADMRLVMAILGLLTYWLVGITHIIAHNPRRAFWSVATVLGQVVLVALRNVLPGALSWFTLLPLAVLGMVLFYFWVTGLLSLFSTIIPEWRQRARDERAPQDLSGVVYRPGDAPSTPVPSPPAPSSGPVTGVPTAPGEEPLPDSGTPFQEPPRFNPGDH